MNLDFRLNFKKKWFQNFYSTINIFKLVTDSYIFLQGIENILLKKKSMIRNAETKIRKKLTKTEYIATWVLSVYVKVKVGEILFRYQI